MLSAIRSIFIKWRLTKKRLSPDKNRLSTQHGFTLIEIISVLVIMGILSSFAVPKFVDLQDHSRDLNIQKAVNQLNAQVRETFQKNKLADESTDPYQGYTGDLGPDVIVTGQAPDTPGSGTIRLAKDSDTYEMTWTPGAKEDTKSHGHLKLGEKL